MDVILEDSVRNERIQDVGCKEVELPKRRYRLAKILSVGPAGNEKYYFNLTAIAVDIVKDMAAVHAAGQGWNNLPKNLPNVKAKIVQLCLQTRVHDGDTFILDQNRLIETLHGLWGSASSTLGVHAKRQIKIIWYSDDSREESTTVAKIGRGSYRACSHGLARTEYDGYLH